MQTRKNASRLGVFHLWYVKKDELHASDVTWLKVHFLMPNRDAGALPGPGNSVLMIGRV